jgi:hypothetical protein
MKTIKLVFSVVLMGVLATVISCTKTNTVLPATKSMTFTATKDASIWYGDQTVSSPPSLSDNGSGASDLLRVGYTDNGSAFIRSLVAFDLSTLPAGANIDKVAISFTLGRSGSNVPTVYAHALSQTWTEGTTDEGSGCYYGNWCNGLGTTAGTDVTWNSTSNGGTAWTTAGGSFASTASGDSGGNGNSSVISGTGMVADVKAWIKSPSSNFGWILKVDETAVTKNGGEQVRYYSKEASTTKSGRPDSNNGGFKVGADASTKPTLTIYYH